MLLKRIIIFLKSDFIHAYTEFGIDLWVFPRKTYSTITERKSVKNKRRYFAKRPNSKFKGDPNRKQNVLLLLGYNGQNYHGMQDGPQIDVKTVEGKLIKALFKNDVISAFEYLDPFRIDFNRTSRTDSGVSAVKQIVSFKVAPDVLHCNDLIGRLNSSLPDDIRIFALKKVPDSFDSQFSCKARTYCYMLPTYTLAPLDQLVSEKYRITDSAIEIMDRTLQNFVGTHNFFNYSRGCNEPKRFYERTVYEMKCSQPFIRENREFIFVQVKGKSFIYHQIRKMIGMAIAIVRSFAPLDVIEKTWQSTRVEVPVLPPTGLFIEDLHFEANNVNKAEFLSWDDYKEELEKFKDYIISSIAVAEKNSENNMMDWLKILQFYYWDFLKSNQSRHTIFGEMRHALNNYNKVV